MIPCPRASRPVTSRNLLPTIFVWQLNPGLGVSSSHFDSMIPATCNSSLLLLCLVPNHTAQFFLGPYSKYLTSTL